MIFAIYTDNQRLRNKQHLFIFYQFHKKLGGYPNKKKIAKLNA